MDARDRRRLITLELETGSEPIHGTLAHRDGTRESFWGRLELMAALEHITSDRRDVGGVRSEGVER